MTPEEKQRILAENKKKDSVLKEPFSAVKNNKLKKVKSIFEKNSSIIKDVVAEINSKSSTNLLGYAVDSKIAGYLIEQGVSFTAAIKNAIPDLKAIKSICKVNKSIVKHELQKDASILEAISYRGFDSSINDIIKYLIEQGANPNSQDHNRYLLHLFIARGKLKWAKTLIENGADINVVNQEEDSYWMSGTDTALKGQTALLFAIRAYKRNINTAENVILNPEKTKEALEFINFLIEKEAKVNIQDFRGQTALDAVIFYNLPKVVKLLIKAGADLNVGKEKAEGVLNYAVNKGHTDIAKAAIRYILEHDSRWLTRLDKPDLLNDQQELSSYWDEYRAQVTGLHDVVGDKIDLTGDGSTRPVMRTVSGFLDHNSRKNLVKASLIPSVSDDRGSKTSESLCPRKLAITSVATISCALALYFLAPLIIGSAAGVGTQLALGAVGAVVGAGIVHLTNVAIDQCYVNLAAQKAD